MCGRYASTKDPATLAKEFDAEDETGDAEVRVDHNVAPTKQVPVVVAHHPRDAEGEPDRDKTVRGIQLMRWGLVPHWAKDLKIGAKMINARVESAATKPAFRTSMAKRRCILPADGWFEWKRDGDRKQPFFMTPKDGSSLAMAGLWTVWRDKANPDAEPVISCSVLTTEAQGQLVDIHDRMPLLLPRESFAAWLDLDAAADADTVAPLLGPPPADLIESLELRPVSTLVNSVRNNGPELVAREQPAQELDLFESQSP